ncbi:NAD(P)-binding domain-containing protein [Microbacterium thalassium]|uniref:Cation diffusion facilitator CzcD-associated flavoprotein CzcO n=1 Tax=Microbacterium thalassium TaxID=362649 RepID=A0A7X0FNR3_9MICO|nr:NAD(P)-binding domain-containing protein [Microbacterium thalassium]MBB6390352.1 cation diffusion facilitator CzcD-associated flavoprotein CzcO [Microbacterium thalassium]GLK25461.1 pyridine nucleotide-disulfide oxidoreductase [Microbacterium thalassium]
MPGHAVADAGAAGQRTDDTAGATVAVIGAGQAGLSAAYHLQRRGFTSAIANPGGERTYVVFDANPRPGGAWQHRWESLTMETVNGIFDLPGMALPTVHPAEASRTAVPDYFTDYERAFDFPIIRPAHVTSVTRADADPDGELVIETDRGAWRARSVINATGTWDNPVRPEHPGARGFRGRQFHTREYVGLEQFAGHRVAIVGGGISAVQHLEEISRVATTFWYTRSEPWWLDVEFEPETVGREVIARVTADAEAGRAPKSVVSYTGLPHTSYTRAAEDRGVLVRRPMFTAIEPDGVREADGSFTPVDTIVWATGFRPALAHLDPLGLRNPAGGITVSGTRVRDEPRLHLIGYGPSQSTVGANRAGRAAVGEIVAALRRAAVPAIA